MIENGFFYEAMLKARISEEENLRNKINLFLENLENWKEAEKEKTLDELIWQIYEETNYYNYVGLLKGGNIKQANLKMLFERAKQYETASFKGLYNFINFLDRLKFSSGDMSSAKIVGENDNVVRIMSIHKSKGLEFPVVFLSGTGKNFNKKDLNETIILHQDLGFGPKYIDSENRISYSTLAKEAIRIKLEKEMISEEMRVLYVALTRAREKLIITGSLKDYKKEVQKIENLLEIYEEKEGKKINPTLLEKNTSYLDWFLLLILKEKKQDFIKVQIHEIENEGNELENIEKQDLQELSNKRRISEEELEQIKQELEWKYKYSDSVEVPTKTSVTKIKENKQKEIIEEKKEYLFETPKFIIKDESNITSARKGSIIHLCLEKLECNKQYSKEDIENFIDNLVNKEIILKEEAESININIILKYLKSNLYKELSLAKEVHKETPFYLEVTADRLDEQYSKEDKILVQGIIDLYYINSRDELILVDYKTDYVEKNEEQKLIERYKEQLNIYKEALEKTLDRKVNKMIIYSTWIGEIEL